MSHPLLPMAAITVEHSLNVGIEDKWQDNLRSWNLDKNGKLFYVKEVSYGYGQIKFTAAMEAEKIVAQVEGRTPQDFQYVEERIDTIAGAYEYAAALMRYYIGVYDEMGFDISQNLGVLTTLYNIGDVETRANRRRNKGGEPGVNYFGWFALHNWQSFDAIYAEEDFSLNYISDLQSSLQELGNDGTLGVTSGYFMDDQMPTLSIEDEVWTSPKVLDIF